MKYFFLFALCMLPKLLLAITLRVAFIPSAAMLDTFGNDWKKQASNAIKQSNHILKQLDIDTYLTLEPIFLDDPSPWASVSDKLDFPSQLLFLKFHVRDYISEFGPKINADLLIGIHPRKDAKSVLGNGGLSTPWKRDVVVGFNPASDVFITEVLNLAKENSFEFTKKELRNALHFENGLTILHEIIHTFGMLHTKDEDSVMSDQIRLSRIKKQLTIDSQSQQILEFAHKLQSLPPYDNDCLHSSIDYARELAKILYQNHSQLSFKDFPFENINHYTQWMIEQYNATGKKALQSLALQSADPVHSILAKSCYQRIESLLTYVNDPSIQVIQTDHKFRSYLENAHKKTVEIVTSLR